MTLNRSERIALTMISLCACWNDAPPRAHPADAAPSDGRAEAANEQEPEEDASRAWRERDLLSDAAADRSIHDGATGALCGVNGRDDCGPFQLCDAVLGCVECARDDDCPLGARHCVVGACVACEVAEDCPASLPSCWPKDHACHAKCAGTCPPDAKLCVSGACWGCATDADCPGARCAPSVRQCVTCLDDTDCTSPTPRCDVRVGACVACDSNDDCGRAAPICDPATRACRVGCTGDAQCPGKRCNPAAAECVSAPADAGTDAPEAGKD
jgi:hypothetical protein